MRRVRLGLAKRAIALAAYIIVILVAAPSAQQQQAAFTSGAPGGITAGPAAEAPDATAIDLLVGRSTILNVGSTIARVSLTVPDVADAMVTTPQQLLIHGKTPGTISLFVWDKAGGIKTYEVNVRRDLSQLVEQVKQLFPGEPITVAGSGKDVVLSGTVSTKYVVDKAADVAAGYVEKKDNVVNLLKQAEGVTSNQVMLRVRFAEVSRSALQELGASFFTGPGGFHDYVAQSSTQQFPSIHYDELDRSSLQGPDKWGGGRDTVDATGGKFSFGDLLNLTIFNNRYNIGTLIKALQEKGLFQSLAEPNLIASNGKEASFLAGGEYPYPVVQPGGNGNAVSITFKEFGVRLNFTPTVLSGDMISLKVRPEVSALDFSNAITLEGFRIPALSTRRTETEVELQDGQTFAIAGLLNNTVTDTMRKIPGIGDIPILGWLFKSKALQKNQTELVVMITPTIIRRGSTGVSEGLPSMTQPFMDRPSKTLPPPAPYVGSPRYPADQPRTGGSDNQSQDAPSPAPAPAPAQAAPVSQPDAATSSPAAMPAAPAADPQPKEMTKEEKKQAEAAAKKQAEADKKAAEEKAEADKKAAEEKAEADKKAAEEKAEADKKAAKEKERQQKLDQERAKREAEVAKKNAEIERKKQEEQKKREKTLAEAAERLRDAQAAYQAEVAKTAPKTASAKPGGGR
jgi:pilus assembly protein CpaC